MESNHIYQQACYQLDDDAPYDEDGPDPLAVEWELSIAAQMAAEPPLPRPHALENMPRPKQGAARYRTVRNRIAPQPPLERDEIVASSVKSLHDTLSSDSNMVPAELGARQYPMGKSHWPHEGRIDVVHEEKEHSTINHRCRPTDNLSVP